MNSRQQHVRVARALPGSPPPAVTAVGFPPSAKAGGMRRNLFKYEFEGPDRHPTGSGAPKGAAEGRREAGSTHRPGAARMGKTSGYRILPPICAVLQDALLRKGQQKRQPAER